MNKRFTNVLVLRKSLFLISSFLLSVPLISHADAKVEIKFSVKNQETISGKVLSEGKPVVGATVRIKEEPTVATSTNESGDFNLNAKVGQTLTVEILGYEYQEKLIAGSTVNFELVTSDQSIDEVVVVGFGTQKKVNLTGAVQSISAKDLENRPITNVSTALQGKFSGVTIMQNSGQPGKDGGTIRVRGVGTINNSSPLVIVDGIESSMDNINPNDIENVSVLKDASSAAIYGSKAANGVILVTTKRGGTGRPILNYSGYVGIQDPTRLPEYLRSYDHARLLNEALVNEGKAAIYDETALEAFRTGSDLDKYPDTDWLGLLYNQNGLQQNHNLQVLGGTEHVKFMSSFGYLDQQGVIDIARAKRYNFRTNIDAQITDRLSLNFGIAYNYENQREPINPYTGDMAQIFRQTYRIPSFIPYKYSNGVYGYYGDGNPIAWMDLGADDNLIKKHTIINATAEYKILDGLTFKQVVGFQPIDNISTKFVKNIQYYDYLTGNPTVLQGTTNLTEYNFKSERLTLQSILEYKKEIGMHNFGVLAGYMQEAFRRDSSTGFRNNFLNHDYPELDLGSAEGQTATGGAAQVNLRSYFGRLNYAFDNKYLVEGNIRYDGSSRFLPQNRWGMFPSFSLGWRVSQESFFQESGLSSVFQEVKFRGGWGRLGNQDLSVGGEENFYPAIYSISSNNNYPFGNALQTGIAVTNSSNENIKWETTDSWNIGLDLSLKQQKIDISLDYFERTTNDILLQLPVPIIFGLPTPYQNAGSISNNGVELQVNYRNSINDFSYSISANASYVNNKIMQWKSSAPEAYNTFYVYQQGLPIRSYFGYETTGIYQSDEEYMNSGVTGVNNNVGAGDLIYKDQNGDNKIDGNDRVFLGSPDPKYMFGLNLGASYKNFDLNVFFQGAADVQGYLWGESVGNISGSDKPSTMYLDRWHATENPNGQFPRALTAWNQNKAESYVSDFWVQDASYVRMKNVTLGYSFSQQVLDRIGLKGLKVYYSGQNLLTFTGFAKGFDPEAPADSRGNFYPQVKTNTLGLNINF
ncbi:SusC/RagA family TonB-linked outer membrane protein [Sphingobacterium hungaricum]|uniref:TonB-dependent receptor n=1 Tax=Sphingobacterium hungaricum TaxID=2082723 RepID=A0A928UUW7_9SPHI|nr:TonB-dependent receptor [Sphingobacterium hungaricum]MBE8713378.1 TonB-dependent receptor [Sphingobacterium hungaricum]